MKRFLLTAAAVTCLAASLAAQDSPLWLRRNDISPDGTSIVFNYKGNIYTVPSSGGQAKQITTNAAYDTDPMWTADGKEIARIPTERVSAADRLCDEINHVIDNVKTGRPI